VEHALERMLKVISKGTKVVLFPIGDEGRGSQEEEDEGLDGN